MPCEIYQLAPQTHTQMMGYVIKTPGDSLIVIDGGTAEDADYLLYLLRRLGGNRPRVKAWFLTHPHSDHVYALYDLLQNRHEAFSLDALHLHYPERRVLEIGEPRSLPGTAIRRCDRRSAAGSISCARASIWTSTARPGMCSIPAILPLPAMPPTIPPACCA